MANQDLERRLLEDVAGAQESAEASQQSIGVKQPGSRSAFNIKAARIGRKKIAEKELRDFDLAVQDAIKHYTEEAQGLDEVEAAKFERSMQDGFNKWKMHLLEKSAKFQLEMQDTGFKRERLLRQRQAMYDAISTSTRMAVGALTGGGAGAAAGASAPGATAGQSGLGAGGDVGGAGGVEAGQFGGFGNTAGSVTT